MANKARAWTAAENDYVRRNWLLLTLDELAAHVGSCGRDLMRRHGRALGLPERLVRPRDAWTAAETEAVRRMALDGKSTLEQIGAAVGRTSKAVQTHISRMGLRVDFRARVYASAKCRQPKPPRDPKAAKRNPHPSGRRTNRPTIIGFTPERDASLAGLACDHLKRFYRPAYHRVILGKEHAGTYQVGTRILSAADMIQLAERHGFGERVAA